MPPPQVQAPAAETTPELELVTYSVAPAQSAKVQGILRRLLRPGKDDAVGTLSEAPGGRIAVLAPAAVHAGVAELVKQVGTGDAVDPAPANVRFTDYLVGGSPAEGQSGPLSAELKPVADTLGAIEGWDGPQWFRMVGHSTLTSIDGDHAEAESATLKVQQVASVDPASGHIVADLDLRLEVDGPRRSPELETRVQLTPGQTLILSTLDGGESLPGNLYIIVRADILPGG